MFALLISLMACGEKEATTEVATTETTTETQTTGTDVPTAVYPSTEEVKQVAPDAGTTVSGTDVTQTTTTTTTETTQTTEDSQTGESK